MNGIRLGVDWPNYFEETEYSLCCKGKVRVWSSRDDLGGKGSASEKREQGGGRNAGPKDCKTPCQAGGKSSHLMKGLWLLIDRNGAVTVGYEQGCSDILTSSWGTQRPMAKFWFVVTMTTSHRQLQILSLFKIYSPQRVGLMKITYNN